MTWEQPYATGEVCAMILDGDTSFVIGFIGHGDTGKMLGWKQVEVPFMDLVEAEAHALWDALYLATGRSLMEEALESDYRD